MPRRGCVPNRSRSEHRGLRVAGEGSVLPHQPASESRLCSSTQSSLKSPVHRRPSTNTLGGGGPHVASGIGCPVRSCALRTPLAGPSTLAFQESKPTLFFPDSPWRSLLPHETFRASLSWFPPFPPMALPAPLRMPPPLPAHLLWALLGALVVSQLHIGSLVISWSLSPFPTSVTPAANHLYIYIYIYAF